MAVTAIIVTHQSADVIARALGCLAGQPEISRIVVVDNASSDETCAIIRKEFPDAEVLHNEKNIGYGKACNQALETVNTEFVLIMNPDVMLDENGTGYLVKYLHQYPDAAIAAPFFTQEKRHPTRELDKFIYSTTFVSGALMLWRMAHMRKVGFFDPAFFLFYEDDDLSIRIRHAGFRMLLAANVGGFHMPGKSCALTEALHDLKLQSSTWSGLYIIKKYFGLLPARFLARWKIFSTWLSGTFSNNAYTKTRCRSQTDGALKFLHNPDSFD